MTSNAKLPVAILKNNHDNFEEIYKRLHSTSFFRAERSTDSENDQFQYNALDFVLGFHRSENLVIMKRDKIGKKWPRFRFQFSSIGKSRENKAGKRQDFAFRIYEFCDHL